MVHNITPKRYDFDSKSYIEKEPVYIGDLTSAMGVDEMTALLSDWCNKGGKDFHVGVKIGENLQNDHRTLQGLISRLCLGVIIGLGKQEYTDARNEKIVALGKQLKQMLDDGDLDMGYMI